VHYVAHVAFLEPWGLSTMNAPTEPRAASGRRGASHPSTSAPQSITTPLAGLVGGAFIAAPLLLLASSIARAAGSEATGGVFGFYAFAGFFLVVFTLTQTLAVELPRIGAVLAFVGVLGAATGVGFSVDGIHASLPDGVELVDDGGTAGALVTLVPGLMFPLACVGIGIVLFLARVQPRWSGAVLGVAGLLFPPSRIGELAPLAITVYVLLLLALAPLGWSILHGRQLIGARRQPARPV